MTKTNKKPLFSVTAKDCKIEYMRSSKGAGGQHRDKTSSACRITHEASGAVGFSQEYREQHKNKSLAFRRMTETKEFNLWVRLTAADTHVVEKAVEKAMEPRNIKVEVKDEKGRWTNGNLD